MSITSGFFNALNGDREYTASQMSQLFDGIIVDGVFPSIGTCFVATVGTGLSINIGIGKSWFRQSWLYNDSILPVAIPGSEVVLDRIDAIVMEFNDSESIRDNTIKLISGTPSSTPERPILTNNSDILQKPICFVLRPAGSITILPEHITNMIGTKDVPFVTGILNVY